MEMTVQGAVAHTKWGRLPGCEGENKFCLLAGVKVVV